MVDPPPAQPFGYDQDVLAWAAEQARLMRAGQFDKLDVEHIAHEIEDVGKSEKRELASRMAVLLASLLKWRFLPAHRGAKWERRVREQRKQVLRKLKEAPSLTSLLSDADWSEGVWGDAVTLAVGETGLDAFYEVFPWHLTDVLDENWLCLHLLDEIHSVKENISRVSLDVAK